MGVYRTDYLMWGAKVDPKAVSEKYDELEDEIDQKPDARFALVYDGMCGKYAIAGRIIAKSDPHEGLDFTEISMSEMTPNLDLTRRVHEVFPNAQPFSLMLFSHFH